MLLVLLFLVTNVAVMVVLTIAVKVMGLEEALAAQGVGTDPPALLVMAGIMGMGGSLLSLLLSKWSAKRLMGLHVIERPANSREAWLLDTVARLARDAGIGMPEVAIFDSPDPMPSPPARAVTRRWSRSAPASCSACARARSRRSWGTRSSTWRTATW